MKALSFVLALALAGCTSLATRSDPQAQFFARLTTLCGQAFEGRVVSQPTAADSGFAGKSMVMHVRECSRDTLRIPFHVGEDRSRTWVITRTSNGLRLKHDHRHPDGSEDSQTQYGGDTSAPGTASRQEFPADAYSKALFVRGNIPQSASNVWALELLPLPGAVFAYELRRPDRHFRVEFDLTRPVAVPPGPWGP